MSYLEKTRIITLLPKYMTFKYMNLVKTPCIIC